MKKAILIVSFGTTYTDTRTKNITAIKQQVSIPVIEITPSLCSATNLRNQL